jgi:hypothetical protein
MSGREGHVRGIAEIALAVLCSLMGAAALAAMAQQPFLSFFYWVVPGEKTNDGPILVLFAYLLLIVVVPAVLVPALRWVGRNKAIALAVASEPALMLIATATCAWAARVPVKRAPGRPEFRLNVRLGGQSSG